MGKGTTDSGKIGEQRPSALDLLRIRKGVTPVTCPRCGTIWQRRDSPDLLGQNCPVCHGYKPISFR